MIRRLGFLFCLCVGLVAPALAQVDQQMQSMFQDLGSMANVSQPSVFMSARGGVITGGSIQVRNKVVAAPTLFNWEPPKLKGIGGCGGIDMVFGSLSFVSKEQLVEYAKSLASNAATYAFDLGLRGICPMCQAEIEKLQGYTNALNLNMKNSCEQAQALMNSTGLKDWSDRRYNDWVNSQNTGKSDGYASSNQGPGQQSPAAELMRSNPNLAKQIVQGNIVWRAMKKANLRSRIADGNDELLQDIMSLVGTRIICVPGDPEGCAPTGQDPDREGSLNITPVAYSLTFEDLLRGSRAGSSVNVLRCEGSLSETGCLKVPPAKPMPNFKGFAQRLREMYLGSSLDVSTTGGLIGRMLHSGSTAPSVSDQAYLNAYGVYGSITMRLSIRSESAGREFASHFAEAVAARYLYAYVRDLLDALSQAIAESKVDATGSLGPLINEAMDRLNEDARRIGVNSDIDIVMLNYAEHIEKAMGPARLPTFSQIKSM